MAAIRDVGDSCNTRGIENPYKDEIREFDSAAAARPTVRAGSSCFCVSTASEPDERRYERSSPRKSISVREYAAFGACRFPARRIWQESITAEPSGRKLTRVSMGWTV